MRLVRRAVRLLPWPSACSSSRSSSFPTGAAHSNPPVRRAAKWPAGPGEQLAERSCYDCHSNLTKWRWYSNVAPASWFVQHDVEEGRGNLNFSEWEAGINPS